MTNGLHGLINILSYPRSGNHLARAILESISNKKTLGVAGNEQIDQPIYALKNNLQLLGRKQHYVEEIGLDLFNEYGIFDYLFVIVRNPFEAISSHCYDHIALMNTPTLTNLIKINIKKHIRKLSEPYKLNSYPHSVKSNIWRSRYTSLEKHISYNIMHWCSIIDCYNNWPDQKKIMVDYDELTSNNTKADTISNIYNFLSNNKIISSNNFDLDKLNLDRVFMDSSSALVRKINHKEPRTKYRTDVLRVYLSMIQSDPSLISKDTENFIYSNYIHR